MEQEQTQKLASQLHELALFWDASGFTAVCAGEDTIYSQALACAEGEMQSERMLSDEDRFLIPSHAPFLLGSCALLMQRAGRICLTDALQKYLPFYPFAHSLLDALRHQTGLADVLQALPQADTAYEQSLLQDGVLDAQTLVRMLCQEDLLPTNAGEYSASNVFLARAALEAAAGAPIEELLRQYVFEPFGMTHTHAGAPTVDCFLYDGTRVSPQDAQRLSGALSTTAEDMRILLGALCKGRGLRKKEAQLLFADAHGRGVCFEDMEGIQTSCAQALGFSCNFYVDRRHDVFFLHMDHAPQAMALSDGQWTYYRKQLRDVIAAAVTYPDRPRLVRYGEDNRRAATALTLHDEQLSYIMDARGCLCRAFALGRRAKAFVLMEGTIAVGLLVTLRTQTKGTYEIDALLIDRRFQGRGYGRILLQKGVAYLKRAGAQEILVGLSAQNIAARALYEQSGFARVQGDEEELLMRLIV